MRLKLKSGLIVAALMIAGLTFLMIFLLNIIVLHPERIPEKLHDAVIGIIIFLTVAMIILFREMKVRWNVIEIRDHELLVRSFLGLGPKRHITLDQVTGFTNVREPSRYNLMGRAIYIYEDDKRTIEISDGTCKNFLDFHDELSKVITLLGDEDYNIFKGLLNAFGVPIRLKIK